ncbi:hypothetical protein ATO6_06795 [Oceanicola sp. 22II-s10i]|uniref:hypothetical protein n=1 Tax=Oceanicola sp. 22II-s10i TaxID=1317116 RepID=UPI000B5289E1|nr:hypothetical protein [Oceanicola sp. 22II-s10i]OWU86503.1 hypothetical protein ATO6_06795 [Oceanicola sp. 22II-s10i]
MHRTFLAAAVAALISTGGAMAATGYSCGFIGGQQGETQADGSQGPWQENGAEYKAEGETIRVAAKDARLECSAAEALGSQGCKFTGCTEVELGTGTSGKVGG